MKADIRNFLNSLFSQLNSISVLNFSSYDMVSRTLTNLVVLPLAPDSLNLSTYLFAERAHRMKCMVIRSLSLMSQRSHKPVKSCTGVADHDFFLNVMSDHHLLAPSYLCVSVQPIKITLNPIYVFHCISHPSKPYATQKFVKEDLLKGHQSQGWMGFSSDGDRQYQMLR